MEVFKCFYWCLDPTLFLQKMISPAKQQDPAAIQATTPICQDNNEGGHYYDDENGYDCGVDSVYLLLL